MRDPERIDRIVALLQDVWRKEPNWRLTQLVINASDTQHDCGPVYYLEDDEIERRLQNMLLSLDRMLAEPKLQMSWKVSLDLLLHAKDALPAPPREDEQEYSALLVEFHSYLEDNELELALDALEELGHLVSCRGEFWRDLERAAESMGLPERMPALRRCFTETLDVDRMQRSAS